MSKPPAILCVHQGHELYGSDRVFLQSVAAITENFPESRITVHLPQSDTKVSIPGIQVIAKDLWVLRYAEIKKHPFKNIRAFFKSLWFCRKLMADYDLVYINTARILPYIVLSMFSKKKFILHVHEIDTGLYRTISNMLLRHSKALVITNSQATADGLPDTLQKIVVHNGCMDIGVADKPASSEMRLLLPGRINSWKGQKLAVQALKILKAEGITNIQLRIVGSVYNGQNHYMDALQAEAAEISDQIDIIEFTSNIAKHYQWADALLVPSTRPEPFGLVAIEAMSAALPVIAANHGGLPEIVVHQETGVLFEPSDANALAKAILNYYNNPETTVIHGRNGRTRFLSHFQEKTYQDNFIKVVKSHAA